MADLLAKYTEAREEGQSYILALILAGLSLIALGLILVWLNIERTKLSYQMRTLQQNHRAQLELNNKLKIEREHLISPQELSKKAGPMGLQAAKAGQTRRMDAPLPASPAPAGK